MVGISQKYILKCDFFLALSAEKFPQPLPYRSLAYNHVLFCDFVTVRFCYLCVIPVHCALFGVNRWTLMLISLDHPLLYLLLPGRPLVTLLSPSASIAIPPLWIWTSLWSAHYSTTTAFTAAPSIITALNFVTAQIIV